MVILWPGLFCPAVGFTAAGIDYALLYFLMWK